MGTNSINSNLSTNTKTQDNSSFNWKTVATATVGTVALIFGGKYVWNHGGKDLFKKFSNKTGSVFSFTDKKRVAEPMVDRNYFLDFKRMVAGGKFTSKKSFLTLTENEKTIYNDFLKECNETKTAVMKTITNKYKPVLNFDPAKYPKFDDIPRELLVTKNENGNVTQRIIKYFGGSGFTVKNLNPENKKLVSEDLYLNGKFTMHKEINPATGDYTVTMYNIANNTISSICEYNKTTNNAIKKVLFLQPCEQLWQINKYNPETGKILKSVHYNEKGYVHSFEMFNEKGDVQKRIVQDAKGKIYIIDDYYYQPQNSTPFYRHIVEHNDGSISIEEFGLNKDFYKCANIDHSGKLDFEAKRTEADGIEYFISA